MLLTTKGACNYLNCSESTLYRMARRGEIQAIKMGSRWKFREETLRRWAREQERKQRMPETGS